MVMDEVKIGILFSLTGTTSVSERGQYQSALLAIKQINEQGGIKGKRLLPVVEDISSDPFLAAKKAEKLILQDKVIALIGLYTSVCRKMIIPLLEKHDALLLYPTQYEGEEQSPNIFYCGPLPNQQLLHFIPWIFAHLGTSFYLIGSDYIYPRETNKHIHNLIQFHGGSVAGESYAPLGTQKFYTHLKEIEQTNPDVVFSTLVGESAIAFYQQYHQAGFTSPIASTITAETEIQAIQSEYAAGHYSSFPYFKSVQSPVNQQFVTEYRRTYGTETISSAMENAYNSVLLLAEALRKSKTIGRTALRHALPGLALNAPQGTIRVDPKNHHLWLNTRIGKVNKHGQFDIIWESDSPIGPVPFSDYLSTRSKLEAEGRFTAQDRLNIKLNQCKVLIEQIKNVTQAFPFTFAYFDNEGTLLETFGHEKHPFPFHIPQLEPNVDWLQPALKKSAIGLALTGHTTVILQGAEHDIPELDNMISIGIPIKGDKGTLQGVLGVFLDKASKGPDASFDLIVSSLTRIIHSCVETIEKNELTKTFQRMLHDVSGLIPESLFVIKGDEILFSSGSAQKLFMKNSHAVRAILSEISNQSPFQAETFLRKRAAEALFEIRVVPSGAYDYVYINQFSNDCEAALVKDKHKLLIKDIIGSSHRFLQAVNLAKSAARIEANVLILGESGTGKDVFARVIHNESERRDKPFVALNCAAIPRELINAELFGYVDGAFTGARRGGNPGKFEAANGGTLFLDEIGDMPLELQATLLRVLQEREVYRVGGHKPIPVDVRIIAATNKKINQEIIYSGSFRSDLYYRLNVFTIELLPLRDRMDDIPELASYFVKELNGTSVLPHKTITDQALQHFLSYSWPGNIRELRNVVERAFYIAGQSQFIRAEHLPEHLIHHSAGTMTGEMEPFEHKLVLKKADVQKERGLLIEALKQYRGNISKAAKHLGLSRTTLYRKMKEYNILKA
ncbi:transporter substrate-binding protein [Paenibacillus naphthalenovorans]|uniref:transporter substrate-binding protein n=1 Tax=Paenibacillus naphthalenovorans TaxID=162209 RepID=UPI003D271B88